jgi:NitT/TauT family transport system substrate-binding protein
MSLNPSRFVAGLALSAVLLASVAAPQPARADDTLTVVLGATTPALMDTLDLVAEGAGFYKRQHLVITKKLVGGAGDAVDACSATVGTICPIGIEPVLTANERGQLLKMFLTRSAHFAYVVAVLDTSPIKTPADFRGKKIGVHILGAAASGVMTTQSALQIAGLTPSDYTFVPVGYEEKAFNAVASGQVDAAAFPYYEFIPFMVAGKKMRIFYHPTLKDVVNVGYAASPLTILEYGSAMGRFSRAIVQAALFVHENPAAAARLLLQAHGKPFTEADVAVYTADLNAWQDDLPAANPANPQIGAFSAAGLTEYIKLLTQAGVTKHEIPVDDVMTTQFIDYANHFDHKAVAALAASMH